MKNTQIEKILPFSVANNLGEYNSSPKGEAGQHSNFFSIVLSPGLEPFMYGFWFYSGNIGMCASLEGRPFIFLISLCIYHIGKHGILRN